jgi:hypothetical protein
MKEKAKSLGLTHLDFDGCSEIWVKSWEDWERFYKVRLTTSTVDGCNHQLTVIARVTTTPKRSHPTANISWLCPYMSQSATRT